MKPSNRHILRTLGFDALQAAEDCTGKSYKEDPDTERLGFGLHLAHVKHVNAMLEEAGDTCFTRGLTWTLERLKQDGFAVLTEEAFVGGTGDAGEPYDERFYILFCARRGILATLESYSRGSTHNPEGSVNSLKYYLNWRRGTPEATMDSYSGHCIKDPGAKFIVPEDKAWNEPAHPALAFCVSFDGREGMFARLAQLEQDGEFITPWLEQPFLWLLNYMDTKVPGYDYKLINAVRLSKLPAEVQAAVAGQPVTEPAEEMHITLP